MATAFKPSFHDSMYACMMSSTVDSSGMLMVLLIAPERNGCAAAIIFKWPRQAIERSAAGGPSEQSNTAVLGLESRRSLDLAVAVDVGDDFGDASG